MVIIFTNRYFQTVQQKLLAESIKIKSNFFTKKDRVIIIIDKINISICNKWRGAY